MIDFKLNNSGSSSGTDVSPESIQQPQKTVIRITRKPWTALGMSIAGGKGSMPFVGNDDVRSSGVLPFANYLLTFQS
jgi:hypothetical protein